MVEHRPTVWDKNPAVLLMLLVLVSALPFVQKPFHIDDPYFIEIAKNILKNPLDPFSGAVTLLDEDYRVFQEFHEAPNTFETMSHPPLVPYFIALVSFLTRGISELPLHVAFLLFPWIACLSLYSLSRRFTETPLAASLLVIASPLFLVHAQNLMTDVPMLALFLASLALFIDGFDRSSRGGLIGAGVFAGLAFLTRYVALSLIPLFFLYPVLQKRPLRNVGWVLAPALLIFAVWSLENVIHHGQLHIFGGTLHYWRFYSNVSFSLQSFLQKAISDISGVGGAAIPVLLLCYALLPGRRKVLILVTSVLIASLVIGLNPFSIEPLQGYTLWQKIWLVVFLASGLFVILQAFSFSEASPSPDSRFLKAWLAILLLSALVLLPFGTGRYMLPALPPASMLLVNQARKARLPFVIGIVLTLCLSWGLCLGDYIYASGYKRAAEAVLQKYRESRIWFVCDWGFRYYMERGGAAYLSSRDTSPKFGDVIIKGEICSLNPIAPELQQRLKLVETLEMRSRYPVRILNPESKAGFYSHGFGLLPYSLAETPLDRFWIYQVQHP